MLFRLLITFFLLITHCEAQVLDRVVASVDREAILNSELKSRISFLKKTGSSAATKKIALEQLINEKLLEQEARTLGLSTNSIEISRVWIQAGYSYSV